MTILEYWMREARSTHSNIVRGATDIPSWITPAIGAPATSGYWQWFDKMPAITHSDMLIATTECVAHTVIPPHALHCVFEANGAVIAIYSNNGALAWSVPTGYCMAASNPVIGVDSIAYVLLFAPSSATSACLVRQWNNLAAFCHHSGTVQLWRAPRPAREWLLGGRRRARVSTLLRR